MIQLCRSDLDSFKYMVGTVSLEDVVGGVVLKDSFDFLGRGSSPLFDDGLLNSLIAQVVGRSIKDAFDRCNMRVKAEVA